MFHASPTPKQHPPIDDLIYWALPNVLAGRPGPSYAPWNTDSLVDQGIGGVISLDGPIRVKELREAGIDHLPAYQPMLLLHSIDDHLRFLSIMPRVLSFVDLHRQSGQATMIHCHYGCDRTGAALACYLVARESMDADTAISSIQRVNPDAMWAVGYSDAVHTFEDSYRRSPHLYDGTSLP